MQPISDGRLRREHDRRDPVGELRAVLLLAAPYPLRCHPGEGKNRVSKGHASAKLPDPVPRGCDLPREFRTGSALPASVALSPTWRWRSAAPGIAVSAPPLRSETTRAF